MKKLSVAVVAALFAGSAFGQTVLTLDIESDGQTAVSTSGPVTVQIYGELSGDASGGLALFGANMTVGSVGAAADLAADLNLNSPMDPVGDSSLSINATFDRNAGVTNPPGPPADTGFGGTDDGSGGLLQIGGGQNTINNSGPALYPVGPVNTGVGSTRVLLAEGDFTPPAGAASGDAWTLTLDTIFANVINSGETGPVYAVSAADVVVGTSLVITFGADCPGIGAGAACELCDVDGNGVTNGLDISAITNSLNFGLTVDAADDPCTDTGGGPGDVPDGVINGLDVAKCTNSLCFGL